MAWTRQTQHPPPLHIYQDPNHDVEAALLGALGPFNDTTNTNTNRQNFVLQSSTSTHNANSASPRKSCRHSSSPVGRRSLRPFTFPPPQSSAGPLGSSFPTDSPAKRSPYYTTSSYNPSTLLDPLPQGTALFSSFPMTSNMNKENMYSFEDPAAQYQNQIYGYKAPGKRAMVESAPLRDRSNKRLRSEESSDFILPQPDEMPAVEDDGGKPAISYATLIGMAILRAPNRRLTLAQIYKWISDNFKHYRASETGWQNSIRHNLSLNKAFVKQERPKDDPGKGNYWAIEPGKERQFCKDRPMRPKFQAHDAAPLQALPSSTPRPATAPAVGKFTLAPCTVAPSAKKADAKMVDSSKFPEEHFSSDATLPASDPAMQDDDDDDQDHPADALAMPPPSRNLRSSPPPHDIGSSPPPMLASARAEDTPPAASTSANAGRKRRFVPQDSGYYSSIESSAVRQPHAQFPHSTTLTSEIGDHGDHHPALKRSKGRAEEEIARIRSSSYDSPTKDKKPSSMSHAAGHKRKVSVHFEYSSPERTGRLSTSALPPLTPAVVFKRPAKPPPSASPGTNLRNHRNRMKALLGDSPGKWTPLNLQTWSPGFGLNTVSPVKHNNMGTPFRDSLFNSAYEDFIDSAADEDDIAARGSPGKKRPKFDRAARSSEQLTEALTASAKGKITASSTMDSPFRNFQPLMPTSGNINSSVAANAQRLRSPVLFSAATPKKGTTGTPSTVAMEFGRDGHNQIPEYLDLSLEHYYPSHKNNATIWGLGIDDDDDDDEDEAGFDLTQDFGAIGARAVQAQKENGSPIRKSAGRPALGRSITSRF